MSETINNNRRVLPPQLVGIGVALILLLVVLLVIFSSQGNGRSMKPLRPTPAAGELIVDTQPLLVTFDQLNSDPNSLLNQRIQVTGDFLRLRPQNCLLINGPTFRWALVSDTLQLDARGYEAIVHLIPDGTSVTVEGFWRSYTGPLGCGKKPAAGTVWYLDVTQIVQPNPLPNFGGVPVDVIPPAGDGGTMSPELTPETPTPAGTETPTPTPTTTGTPSATPTATPSPDGLGGSETPTATPTGTLSPTVTGTPPTATPSATPTATLAPGITPTLMPPTPIPPTPTQTSGGYPAPDPYP